MRSSAYYSAMKREIEEGEIVSDTESEDSAADTLMLLSRVGQPTQTTPSSSSGDDVVGRVFECKSCNRKFSSFQALGGHRAGHKKPRPSPDGPLERLPPKAKMHECSICGQEFALGQALGGHMRRHRAALAGSGGDEKKQPTTPDDQYSVAAVVKKSGGSKMRGLLGLDLNLTPAENALKWTANYVRCEGA